jgi:hypothetical protein
MRLNKISSGFIWAALLLLAVFVYGLFQVKFDTDIRKFDISYESSAAREAVYRKAFIKTDYPYILLYSADTFDALLEQCRKDKIALLSEYPGIKLVSPSDFFTPEAEQKRNLQLWKDYIASGKWAEYKKDFLKRAAEYEFSEEFFALLFAGIEKSVF